MKPVQFGPSQITQSPNHVRIDMPSSVGKGGIDILSFASGLRLLTVEPQLKQPALFQTFIEKSCIGFSFCLNGRSDYQPAGFDRPFQIKAGTGGFFSFPKTGECIETINGKQMLRIALMLDADHLFTLANGDDDRFYTVLKSLEKKAPCRMVDAITPAMRAILKQMLHCPYCGMTQRIFLEGKAMELLAHKLEQICPCGCDGTGINASDTERVHYAARLLVHDLENPPDIMTLTRSVGLNRNKLHRCFRQVFGRSPFEYLRNHRLQAAMQLLQGGETNVTEAALMVGYTNLSYFTKAFKSMFGVAPGKLRK